MYHVNRIARCAGVLLATALLAKGAAAADVRTWTNYQGKRMEASFVELASDSVILERAGGKRLRVPLNQLSRDDQIYARTLSAGGSAPSAEAPVEIPPHLLELFGERLYNADGDKVSVATLADKKKIGIYFSAHWCPPCRTFTPELVKTYNELKEDNESFEIVFVSSDRDKKAMFDYMEEMKMPWLAVKHESDEANELKRRFDVRGIPKLVVVNDKGELLTDAARTDVASVGKEAYNRW